MGAPPPRCTTRSVSATPSSSSASASRRRGRRSRSSGSRTTSTRRARRTTTQRPRPGSAIDPAGPLALRSTLPVDAIVAALEAEGIPAEVSRDAGGYLCNHVFYVLLQSGRRGGFVHVPPLDVLPLDALVRAAEVIVATSSSRA
jgi:hypothetical protein